jgi:hypothetical protein
LGATSGGAASLEVSKRVKKKLVVPGERFDYIATVIRTLVGREPAAMLLSGEEKAQRK